MEVVRDSFEAGYEEFAKHAANATYCAMDLEMTGISIPNTKLTIVDSLEDRYEKMREVATKFNIIQIGFCLIETDGESTDFVLRPYNCYMFPKSSFGGGPVITMEAGAVEFNSSHNMDWNKWIREGVSYSNTTEAEKLAKDMEKERKDDQEMVVKNIVAKEEKDVAFVTAEVDKFRAWFTENLQTLNMTHDTEAAVGTDAAASAFLQYDLPNCNSFLRGCLFNAIHNEFKYISPLAAAEAPKDNTMSDDAAAAEAAVEVVEVKYPSNVEYVIRNEVQGKGWTSTGHIMLLTPAQVAQHLKNKEAKRQLEFSGKVGLGKFWNVLLKNNIGFIGHNCYYDILFLYHYLHNSLPENFEDFRSEINRIFPSYYDTKLIYSSPEFQKLSGFVKCSKTHLGELFKAHSDSMANQTAASDASSKVTQDTTATDTSAAGEADATKAAEVPFVYKGPTSVTCGEGYTELYNADSNKFHEAGYDAYCTAYLFCHILSIINNNSSRPAHSFSKRCYDIEKFSFHTYSMFSLFATNLTAYATLADCRKLTTGTTFVVTGFEQSTNNNDLTSFFNIDVKQLKWVNNCIVCIDNVNSDDAERLIARGKEHSEWKLRSYDQFMADVAELKATETDTCSSPKNKRKLDGSDNSDSSSSKRSRTSDSWSIARWFSNWFKSAE